MANELSITQLFPEIYPQTLSLEEAERLTERLFADLIATAPKRYCRTCGEEALRGCEVCCASGCENHLYNLEGTGHGDLCAECQPKAAEEYARSKHA